MTLESLSAFCGVELRALPEFLLDHTLLEENMEARLPELCRRWTQLVTRLWSWRGEAAFCLRFDGRPGEASIGVYLLARPFRPERRAALQRELEVALAAYGASFEAGGVFSLLTPDEVAVAAATDADRAALRAEIEGSFGRALGPAPGACFAAVVPQLSDGIWFDQAALGRIADDPRLRRDLGPAPAAGERPAVKPWIPLSWAGPTGSFLLPFKALMMARSPVRVSVHLEPTRVAPAELLWLEKLSAAARRAALDGLDPAAELASRLAADGAARLLRQAFLVAVECAGTDDEDTAAVARSIHALAVDAPAPAAGEPRPLPGARVCAPADEGARRAAAEAHAALAFPRWADDPAVPAALRRLSCLTDAAGAATVFRLPVSVRGGVPGVRVRQPPPDFNPGPPVDGAGLPPPPAPRLYRARAPRSRVTLGAFAGAGQATIDVDELAKHTLITGFTGSGKTQTVLHLLHQLWLDHRIPFLVLESAKTEYRGLLGVPDFQVGERPLQVYTLGDESVAPFRLNPFEVIPGARVETHVGRLQTCFEAALPPFGPLASILEQSIIECYRDRGWMMTDVGPERAARRGRPFPEMTQFAAKLEEVASLRGYKGENHATLIAAVRGRILPLTRAMHGSKGKMLDTQETVPAPEALFSGPVILELDALNEQDRALVVMFVLTLLREHREQEGGASRLRHCTVVEEAHNVLERQTSNGGQEGASADTRYRAVQAFCGMLSEIRALGEGLVIADQSPVKLAPDALRNTNLQIAHQLRDATDREAVAQAMTMSDEQRAYLGKLEPGQAALFATGLERASFVRVPAYASGRGAGFSAAVPDAAVARHMHALTGAVQELDRPFDNCRHCGHRTGCDYRWPARALTAEPAAKRALYEAFQGSLQEALPRLWPLLQAAARQFGAPAEDDAAWCALLHLRHRHLDHFRAGGPFDRHARALFLHQIRPRFERTADPPTEESP